MSMGTPCYPYGGSISCFCDDGGRIYNCFPLDESSQLGKGSFEAATKSGGPVADVDGRTELILAVTLILFVILTFLRS